MLTLFSVGGGSGDGSELPTAAVAALISAGVIVAIAVPISCIVTFLCKLLLGVIKKSELIPLYLMQVFVFGVIQ